MAKTVIVITTIAKDENHDILNDWAKFCTENNPDFEMVLVGDMKTGDAAMREIVANHAGVHFLSIDEQESRWPELCQCIPVNKYCLKNFGYIYAYNVLGADYIFDTDDDNVMMVAETFKREIKECMYAGGEPIQHGIVKPSPGHAWANVMRLFGRSNLWPRGLPLHEVRSGRVEENDYVHIGVTNWLVDGDPDLDAIGRLVFESNSKGVAFDMKAKPVALDYYCWSPWNSQATFWSTSMVASMWLPVTCNSRVEDILRSYMVNRLLWQNETTVAFRAPILHQDRNSHDTTSDLRLEFPLYINGAGFADTASKYPSKTLLYSELLQMAGSFGLISNAEVEIWEKYTNALK
jgi:hypothetical protein